MCIVQLSGNIGPHYSLHLRHFLIEPNCLPHQCHAHYIRSTVLRPFLNSEKVMIELFHHRKHQVIESRDVFQLSDHLSPPSSSQQFSSAPFKPAPRYLYMPVWWYCFLDILLLFPLDFDPTPYWPPCLTLCLSQDRLPFCIFVKLSVCPNILRTCSTDLVYFQLNLCILQ